ncbi:MAG TPA: hypothetical protein EYN66_08370 [Myxococcales bacterium]|nr:hypothetical protein [Myxococcales bacterium]
MAHGMASWRASAIMIPSGADVGLIYRLLSAPPEAALRVVQLSAYGDGGSARFSAFLIPPTQGNAAIYSVDSIEPIYGMCVPFACNGATQTAPSVILPSLNSAGNGIWLIPAGWSMGIMPSLSTTGETEIRAVAIITSGTVA